MDDAHIARMPGDSIPLSRAWAAAMRLPFTSVAIVPFGVGAYIGYANGGAFSLLSPILGVAAVFAICVGCYLSGEVFDQREDLATLEHGRNPFSGGSLMVANGRLSRRSVVVASVASFALAAALGAAIFVLRRDVALVGLGAFGLLVAAIYSVPPIRLVSRGIGELFIGVCYGWLTIATGHFAAVGSLPPHGVLVSLPVALTVFDIILLNEFPDYEADRGAGKRNLLVRVGRTIGAWIYALAMLGAAASVLWIWSAFAASSPSKLLVALAVAGLSTFLAIAVGPFGWWRTKKKLEIACGLTIVCNLLSALAVGALARWR